jgi:hypothetical protein
VLSEEKNRLEDLESEDLRLEKLDWATVELDQTKRIERRKIEKKNGRQRCDDGGDTLPLGTLCNI